MTAVTGVPGPTRADVQAAALPLVSPTVPSAALPAAPPTVSPAVLPAVPSAGATITVPDSAAARRHLLDRLTYGASPADLAQVAKVGMNAWLKAQLNPSAADPESERAWKTFPLSRLGIAVTRKSIEKYSWDAQFEVGAGAVASAMLARQQVREVLADTFHNILNVTIPSEFTWDSAGDWVHGVIRRHALGRYDQMLLAAMRHPAMLRYLGNDESTRTNVNENLGRELLELHTVGLAAGYTEADVRASAQILSGRTVGGNGLARFSAADHYAGRVTVLGFTHANAHAVDGLAAGDAYLTYLARHPSTAATIARRLAQRFVSDDPSPELIDRLAAVYLSGGTAITPVVWAIVASSEFWEPGTKARRPLEDMVGTVRRLGISPSGAALKKSAVDLYWQLDGCGHAPMAWPAPNGYPDAAAAWQSSGAAIARWNVHRALACSWWDAKPPKAFEKTFAPASGERYAAWAARIGRAALGVPVSDRTLAAMLTFLEAKPTEKVPSWMGWKAGLVAALALDSPDFQIV